MRGVRSSLVSMSLARRWGIVTGARHSSSTPAMPHSAAAPSSVRGKIEGIVDSYEEFIGVKAVKEAQAHVMMWEEELSTAQLRRREKQAELKGLQSRLKEIHFDLDRTSRGEDKYLHLLTEEHATIKKERELMGTFEALENNEREAFYQLSTKVRESHEKERERAEKTKWWGVTASLAGAFLGILGSSIGNELRMRRFKEMLPATNEALKDALDSVVTQQMALSAALATLQGIEGTKAADGAHSGHASSAQLIETIRTENQRLAAQIAQMSERFSLKEAIADPEAVVYVGSDMERLLDQTERNLESKMKLQTLLSVVVLYSALGLTIPVLWAFFKGG